MAPFYFTGVSKQTERQDFLKVAKIINWQIGIQKSSSVERHKQTASSKF